MKTANRWTSWHLHLNTEAVSALDRIISDVAAPAAAEHRWFFIRYWQGGPHVRLRVADLDPAQADTLECRLVELMDRYAGPREGEPIVEADAYAAEAERHTRGETGENRHVSELRGQGVHQVEYDAEVERYGGAAVMADSEHLFTRSSALVVQLLPDLPEVAPRRQIALRLTEAAARTLGPQDAHAVFYEIGRRSWSAWARSYGFDADIVDRVAHASTAPSAEAFTATPAWLSAWQTDVGRLVSVLHTAGVPIPGSVVSSHVHMTHNRLGLTILDELRTYALLARTFPAPAGAVPDLGLSLPA